MDPYSAEGELINIHNHFHQGQYQEVVDFDVSSLSPENALAARVLQLRARVALGQAEGVLAEVRTLAAAGPAVLVDDVDPVAALAVADAALRATPDGSVAVDDLTSPDHQRPS